MTVSSKEIARIAEEAGIAVKAAEPALEAAKEALKNVRPADITEIANLGSPPEAIRHVCTVVFHFFFNQKDSPWDVVKIKLLKLSGLCERLKTLDMNSISKV